MARVSHGRPTLEQALLPQPVERAVLASPRRTKLLIYGINYSPELIGVGRYTGELGLHLLTMGHDLEVVTAPPHYPGWAIEPPYKNSYNIQTKSGFRITRCPLLLRRKMHGIWRVLAPLTFAVTSAPIAIWRIITSRPDAVLCVEPTLFTAPLALLAAKLIGARTVLHVQDLEIDAAFAMGHLTHGWLKSMANIFEKLVLRGFDSVVTISNEMNAQLHAKGVPDDRLVIIRNWVNTDKIKPIDGPSPYRNELGLKGDTFIALYAGSIGVKQSLHIVLDAAELLLSRADIVFIIAGDGPQRENLMARKLPNVRFLPLQPESRLSELLAAADVHLLPQDAGAADLVLPSKLGGMLASGKPILVQADAGTELFEFLTDAACIVPAGDASALAAALADWQPDTCEKAAARDALAQQLSSNVALDCFSRILFE